MGIISKRNYNRADAKLDFLEQAQQAATVEPARKALEKGKPWMEENFADSVELTIWQSNLNYLKTQSPQALIPDQIKQSIVDNAEYIYHRSSANIWYALYFSCLLLNIVFIALLFMETFNR